MDPTVPRMSAVHQDDDATLKARSAHRDEPSNNTPQWQSFDPQAVRVSAPQRSAAGGEIVLAVVVIVAVLVVATACYVLIRSRNDHSQPHSSGAVTTTLMLTSQMPR
jgi:uncharacterized protein HemX